MTTKSKTPAKTTSKRVVKAAPVKKTETKAAEAPKSVNTHLEAGINVSRYNGPSKFVNANRKTKIMLGREVVPAKLTSRAQAGFYALRDCYDNKSFNPKGFDNGILRDLVGAGLITLSGGQKSVIDGTEYMMDGAKAVVAKITAAGMAYGKAA